MKLRYLVPSLAATATIVAALSLPVIRGALLESRLISKVGSDDEEEVAEGISRLVEINPPRAVLEVIRSLPDEFEQWVFSAGQYDVPQSNDARVRVELVRRHAKECAGALGELVSDRSAQQIVRRKAAALLALLGSEGLDVVRYSCLSADEHVRALSIRVVGELGARATRSITDRGHRGRKEERFVGLTLSLLDDASSDPAPAVREAAVLGFGSQGSLNRDSVLSLLRLHADPDPRVRLAFADSVPRIDLRSRRCDTLPQLRVMMLDTDELVAATAIRQITVYYSYGLQQPPSFPYYFLEPDKCRVEIGLAVEKVRELAISGIGTAAEVAREQISYVDSKAVSFGAPVSDREPRPRSPTESTDSTSFRGFK